MKTSRVGSMSSWPSNQALRRFRISGRFCSPRGRSFFARDPVAVEEPPERANPDPYAPVRQPRPDPDKGDVRRLGHKSEDHLRMRLDLLRTAVAALTLNRSAAWRHDIPWAVASTTRRRRSVERALAMHAGLLYQHAA